MIYSSRGTRVMVESMLLGTALGLLVVLPWTTGGYLMLLDWVSGPQQSLTPGVYGLSGSAVDAMPFRIATQAVRAVIGPAPTAWMMIAIFFPLGAGGIAAATRGSRWRVYPAVALFCCNPFVVDRIRAGHVSTLLCLALLPWIFTASVHARKQDKWFAVRPALWFALAMAISPHAAWLGGTIVVMVWLLPSPSVRGLVRALFTILMAGAVYTYALVVWVTGSRTLNVTEADLLAYATRPGWGGTGLTVMSLRGFWRSGAPGWDPWQGMWFALPLLIVIIALVVLGLVVRSVEDPLRGVPLAALTLVGLLLGAGVNGPLSWFYRWAFDHLPLFEAMREQQKWLSLAVLGYSVGLGSAVEALARGRSQRGGEPEEGTLRLGPAERRWSRPVAVLCGCLPLVVAPTLLWGLGRTIATSDYPASWARAERVMGPGQGSVLFLPWHAYQPFEFTDERTVATPGAAYFSRPVLASDAVQLPGLQTDSTSLRTAYVDRVLAAGGTGALARMLAPLGIEYIVVARNDSSPEYTWVRSEPGLERIDVGADLELYRLQVRGTGRVASGRTMTFEEAMAAAAAATLGTEAVLAPDPPTVTGPTSTLSGDVVKTAPTRWQLGSGVPGWVVIPEEWSPKWELAGVSGRPTLAGTIAFEATADPGPIVFTTWRLLRPALAVSVLALLALIVAGVLEHRRDLDLWPARGPTGRPPSGK